MKKEELVQSIIRLIPESNSINELITKKLNLTSGGGSIKFVKNVINDYNLDISHFGTLERIKFNNKSLKKCKICENTFKTIIGSTKEQSYCSISCSNKDRIVNDETKDKLRQKATSNYKLKNLIKKYGENYISSITEEI